MKIMVVDDSKVVRYMITKVLNELGYTDITEADTVETAVSMMEVSPPQLIFSDLNMPGKNGLDFLKYVRSTPQLATIPFVMITTVHEKKIILEAVKAGLQYYLYKPVEKHIMMEKLLALAHSHGIQPPLSGPDRPESPPADSAALPVNSTELSPETITETVVRFFLVFDGELTISDFQDWLAEKVLPVAPPAIRGQTPRQLLELLRNASADGLRRRLQAMRSG